MPHVVLRTYTKPSSRYCWRIVFILVKGTLMMPAEAIVATHTNTALFIIFV